MPGISVTQEIEEDMVVDEPDANTTYQAWPGEIGASGASAVWKIRRILKVGNVTSIKWADNNTNYDNIWDDRASLSYG